MIPTAPTALTRAMLWSRGHGRVVVASILLVAGTVLGADLLLALAGGGPIGSLAAPIVALALLVAGVHEVFARHQSEPQESAYPPLAPSEVELALIERAADARIVVDRSGRVIYASAAVSHVLGYRPADLLGLEFLTLASSDSAKEIMQLFEVLAGGERTRIECQIRHHDGHWVLAEAIVIDLSGEGDGGRLALTFHDVSRWKKLEERLMRQAFHDPLTGLPNRGLFIDRLEHALGRRRHDGKAVAVLFLDLDDFKTVNDSLGHVEGDILISLVAGRLAQAIRPEDTAARLGGDEFALLIENVDQTEAAAIAARILSAMQPPFELTERPLRVGASVGLALSSARLVTATDMLRAADIAMYTAKERGKGQYRVFEEHMQDATEERLRLAVDIRGAVERGEFVVHYQPVVLLPSGTVVGMEALVRWNHPERGLLSPAEFVPLAEATGLIIPLGDWVLRTACLQARAWHDARPGQAPLMMNVNLSGTQLQYPGLVTSVAKALEESGLPAEMLTLEITESVMAETDSTIRRLRQLKGMGVGIAIDDFGTGYSSLSYLRRFPIDVVKIDKSFVSAMASGAGEVALARAIVRLAHSMKMKTVAEGVETEAQAEQLSSMGCDLAQGYHFGRPLDADQATAEVLGQTTISLWIGHTGHELDVIKSVVAKFETENAGLRVYVHGGMTDDRIIAAIGGPEPPNVVGSFKSHHFGAYAMPGGLVELEPYMRRDNIEPGSFNKATHSYTQFDDRWFALPMLADVFGLYCNRELLAMVGSGRPPRTISELTAAARQLTTRYPDRSLAIVGFDPMFGFYENAVGIFGHMFGAHWTTPTGLSALARDPAWARMFTWQKELIDWYGYEDLLRFHAKAGEEFSPSNAFQTGRLAMCVDGAWRLAFITDHAGELDYESAPLPVDDARPDLYGSSYVSGTIMGIPANAGHKSEGWKLLKYLTTDDHALAMLSNGLRNLPSTRSSLGSPELVVDDRFAVFLGMLTHPLTAAAPISSAGSFRHDGVQEFVDDWQAGRVPDLMTALRDLDSQIDARLRGQKHEPPGIPGELPLVSVAAGARPVNGHSDYVAAVQ